MLHQVSLGKFPSAGSGQAACGPEGGAAAAAVVLIGAARDPACVSRLGSPAPGSPVPGNPVPGNPAPDRAGGAGGGAPPCPIDLAELLAGV